MAFNGSGTFVRLRNWVADATAGVKIRADYHDNEDDGFAAGLTNCVTRDGQSPPSADLPMNAKKLTNLGTPVNPADAATKAYVDAFPNGVTQTLVSTDAAGGISPNLILDRNSASPAANDYLGGVFFRGRDSTNAATDYATIRSQIVDPLNTSEDGQLALCTMVAGTLQERLRLGPTGLDTVLGQGNLTFVQKQVSIATGAVTLHADTRVFYVEIQGGGGAGGGAAAGVSGQSGAAGGGGGAGGYAAQWFTRTAATSCTCSTGAGGALVGGANGGSGGQTVFNDGVVAAITANGGVGGTYGISAALSAGQIGLGGTAVGQVTYVGQSGGMGWAMFNPSPTGIMLVISGAGGSSYFGAGGQQMLTSGIAHAGSHGSSGRAWGAGGSGGVQIFGNVHGGGAGVAGAVLITEYK